MSHGGDLIARVLQRHGVTTLFTLCGGHISPILVGAKALGIRIVDTRHEVDAVFAADATARLTGIPGVAAVTAGPGLTNTITAIKNAQMAQSPVILLGGATATVLKGRGSLQDIDQQALMAPHVKWQGSARRVRELVPLLETAFAMACEGLPGPVFLECPVDLLYPEETTREWYGVVEKPGAKKPSFSKRLELMYLRNHLRKAFSKGGDFRGASDPVETESTSAAKDGGATGGRSLAGLSPSAGSLRRAVRALARADRPLVLVGSQTMLHARPAAALRAALEQLGAPVYLSGMARGLLGGAHPLLRRHKRREALREADCVVLLGVPADFRLDYGRHIRRDATLISANRSAEDLDKNRRPQIAALADPALFLEELAERASGLHSRWNDWLQILRERDLERESEIAAQVQETPAEGLNPLRLLRDLDDFLADDAVLVADGGDFVGTASYVVRARGPLGWLDPGVFGTLGVGGGFALGAKLARPDSEVWILYGDGSVAYSLMEFDTFARHRVPVIALVGNDASWAQIARDQIAVLGDDVGTVLASTDYELAAEALGGKGLSIDHPDEIVPAFEQARVWAKAGHPVLLNARLARSEFRKGSISL
ncbi:MAG: thiamine pyrophosphate-binding protein [Thermoanaerobaculia bacterium]